MYQYIELQDVSSETLSRFDGTEIVVTPQMVLFWKPPSPFDQWTKALFSIDGVGYVCAEQFMMAEKARLFQDFKIERQIMSTDDPRRHQQLGKQVAGFDKQVWERERYGIVLKGNLAKFSNNKDIRDALLQTGERRLVEASPIDRIWGIGLSASNPLAYDPQNWLGLNLLGMVLEDVRTHLRGSCE